MAVMLPVVLDLDPSLGLRLLDRAIHEQAIKTAAVGPNRTEARRQGVGGVYATGSVLLEIVPGSVSRQIFVLKVPGLKASDLRDLAVAHHSKIRCAHTTKGEPSRRNQTADGLSVASQGISD